MKKFLSILLTLALVIGVFPPVAKAQFIPEEFRQHLNQYVKEEFYTKDFFPPSIEGGHRFGAFGFDTLSDSSQFKLDIKLPEDILIPNYGEPFDYTQRFGIQRYLGYTPQGHPNSNPVHPFDEWAGGILETRNWISEPWGDDGVQQKIASQLGVSTDEIRDSFPKEMSMGIRDIPQIREKILYGLEFSRYNSKLIYDTTNSPGKGINYPWEEKIMVYYPPTDESWGLGLMWQYAGGVLYYKDMWIPNRLPTAPDFYPTPEGSNQWQPQYKDPKICAKTYTYEQGQTEITFPVNLFNQGEKAITDFKAVWFNSSKVNPKPWDSPVWQNDTEISIAKGESKTFNVTVPLPVPDYAGGKLVFLCNRDGKTPANEINQENNMMMVKILEEGIDIQLMLPDDYPPIILNQGESYRVPVSLMVTRNDPFQNQKPVDVNLTYTSPAGTVTKQIVINPFPNDYYEEEINFTVNREGTYIVSGEAYPINVTDPDLSNNKDSTRIPVRIKESASKTDADDQTRVNLRS
jgi:hypothetical protein